MLVVTTLMIKPMKAVLRLALKYLKMKFPKQSEIPITLLLLKIGRGMIGNLHTSNMSGMATEEINQVEIMMSPGTSVHISV